MILIKTEASSEIGFGHATRCMSLASLIKSQNKIHLLINEDKILVRTLKSRKIPFSLVKSNPDLGKMDLKAILLDIPLKEKKDLPILKWAEENGIPVAEFSHHPHATANFVKSITLSPQTIMLHPRYRHFHKIERNYSKNIHKIFLSLGGKTKYRMLRKTIDILVPISSRLKIALSPYLKNSCKKVLRRLYPKIHFVGETDNLARSLFEADLALLTPGMVAYEAAAVGTPALYVFEDKELESMASLFEDRGAGKKLCNIQQIKEIPLEKTLSQMTQKNRQAMGEMGKSMVDGMGIYRVIDFLRNEDII